MAKKKKPAVTKTQAIKEALTKFPKLGPKDLAGKLKSNGVNVSPAYVSTIKSGLQRKAGKKPRTAARRARANAQGGYVAVSALEQAQQFIEKAGGVDQAREALNVVAKLK